MSLSNYIYQLEQLAAQAPGTDHERRAKELIERAGGERRQKHEYVEIERRKRERRGMK